MELKIAFLIIVATVSNVLAISTYSQAAKVSLDMENRSLEQVMDEIERQSEFYFIFNQKQIDINRIVDIQAESELITEILPELFKGTNVNYAVFDRKILLTTDPINNGILAISSGIILQQKQISGKVTDETGSPLPGVNIHIEGTTVGVISDVSGKYSINIPNDNAVLIFSFIGYSTQRESAGGKTIIDITLVSTLSSLEEVVVVGYGTMKKANLTGAIATTSGEIFENRPITNVGQALVGKVANLNVLNYDGGPGQKTSINIRGYAGLGTSYTPLIIVDGVAGSLNDLNPNDIEALTVLKDASSSAIYGSRAAYGVILVTTKSGKKNQKPVISYTTNLSWSNPTVLPETAGSLEFAKLFRESSINAGGGGVIDLETLDRIEKYYNDPESIPNNVTLIDDPRMWSNWGDGRCNGNSDWYEFMFKPAFNQAHNISVQGGGETTSFMMSLGSVTDNGKMTLFDDSYKRINANAKVSTEVTRWLTVGVNMRFSNEKTLTLSYDIMPEGGTNNYLGWVTRMWPTMPIYEPNGRLSTSCRAGMVDQPNTTYTNNLWGTGTALFKIIPGMTINLDFTYNLSAMKHSYSKGLTWWYAANTDVPFLGEGSSPETTQVWQESRNDDYTTSNAYITYDKKLGEHSFKILAGTQMEYQKIWGISVNKKHLLNYDQPSISTAIGALEGDDILDHWTTLGYFGRLNYDYLSKYLFEFNLRRDGSSRYPDSSIAPGGSKWGTFPSFSAGWNIANESFFSPFSKYFSELKLRGSWGELGNMRGKSYQYISTISYEPAYPYIMDSKLLSAFGTPSLISYNTWETNRTLDFGIDISSLKSRFNASFDWYQRDIIGLITKGTTLPAVLGATSPQTNNADVRNIGWELSLSWRDSFKIIGKPFSYNGYFNLSDYQGKVIKYSNPKGLLSDWYVGQSMGEIWGYTTDHIMIDADEAAEVNTSQFQKKFGSNWTQGDMKYVDLDNSGFVDNGSNTLDDHGDISVIGNTTPRYSYSFGFDAEWNGFDISLFFTGIGKRDIWLQGNLANGLGGGQWNSQVWKNTLDCWRNDGSNMDPYWPKFYLNNTGKNLQKQTKYLDDVSFLRLRNLQIGYSIPSGIINRLSLQKIRFYFSGDNLLLFSKINENFDPEAPGTGNWNGMVYPLNKTLSLGINVTF